MQLNKLFLLSILFITQPIFSFSIKEYGAALLKTCAVFTPAFKNPLISIGCGYSLLRFGEYILKKTFPRFDSVQKLRKKFELEKQEYQTQINDYQNNIVYLENWGQYNAQDILQYKHQITISKDEQQRHRQNEQALTQELQSTRQQLEKTINSMEVLAQSQKLEPKIQTCEDHIEALTILTTQSVEASNRQMNQQTATGQFLTDFKQQLLQMNEKQTDLQQQILKNKETGEGARQLATNLQNTVLAIQQKQKEDSEILVNWPKVKHQRSHHASGQSIFSYNIDLTSEEKDDQQKKNPHDYAVVPHRSVKQCPPFFNSSIFTPPPGVLLPNSSHSLDTHSSVSTNSTITQSNPPNQPRIKNLIVMNRCFITAGIHAAKNIWHK